MGYSKCLRWLLAGIGFLCRVVLIVWATLAKFKESNLRFVMSEVSKHKPIAACRRDTAQAQHPFAISVNLVNDHAFDRQL